MLIPTIILHFLIAAGQEMVSCSFVLKTPGFLSFVLLSLLTQILKYAAESVFIVNNCFALNL
ncbi:hypothetical protein CDQ83_19595 [Clostridium thermosuccinogenes]|nr:hypothetical protein CDQ83_19595 [Pseudoclostridium thermosuccinogenes]